MFVLIVALLALVFFAGMVVGERKGVAYTEQRWSEAAARDERRVDDERCRLLAELHRTRVALRNHLASRKA